MFCSESEENANEGFVMDYITLNIVSSILEIASCNVKTGRHFSQEQILNSWHVFVLLVDCSYDLCCIVISFVRGCPKLSGQVRTLEFSIRLLLLRILPIRILVSYFMRIDVIDKICLNKIL